MKVEKIGHPRFVLEVTAHEARLLHNALYRDTSSLTGDDQKTMCNMVDSLTVAGVQLP